MTGNEDFVVVFRMQYIRMEGPKKKGPVHLKSADGLETFSESKRVVARWSEHFKKPFNVPGDIDHEALDNIPQRIT